MGRRIPVVLATVALGCSLACAASCTSSDDPVGAEDGVATASDSGAEEDASTSMAGSDAASDCSFVLIYEDGRLLLNGEGTPIYQSLRGPLREIDEYPSNVLAGLGSIATALAAKEPGVYVYEFMDFPPLVQGQYEGEGWFMWYGFLVDEERTIWRLYQEGILPVDDSEVTYASAVERVDPAAVATLARDCNDVVVYRRWQCVHDTVMGAPVVATCGEPNAGVR